MRCALKDLTTELVANVIMADTRRDHPPAGFALIQLDESDAETAIGWTHGGDEGFRPPLDQLKTEAARRDAIAAEAFSAEDRDGVDVLAEYGLGRRRSVAPFVFADKSGSISFRDLGDGLYSCSIETADDVTGAARLALINAAFEAAFAMTDAVLIRGVVSKSNRGILGLISGMSGTYRVAEGADEYIYHLPVTRWARRVGLDAAVERLIAAGRPEKAAKISATKPVGGSGRGGRR